MAPTAGMSRQDVSGRHATHSHRHAGTFRLDQISQARGSDDILLKEYRETIDPDSPNITLFSPAALNDGYFAEVGFIADAASGPAPGPDTVWTAAEGQTLTPPPPPVTLTYDNGAGLVFTRVISVDEHFLFKLPRTPLPIPARRPHPWRATAESPGSSNRPLQGSTCCMKA